MLQRFTMFFVCFVTLFIQSQAQGYFSGDLQLNAKIFDTDEDRGAAGTPFYNWAKSSSDSWLTLNYTRPDQDFDFLLRFDIFNNSDLFTGGTIQNNGLGLGAFYIKKQIGKLEITGGYIYDQLGSGLTFRTFENRGLGLDNALVGVRGQYDLTDNLSLKAMAGKLKNIKGFVQNIEDKSFIEIYQPYIKAAELSGSWSLGESGVNIAPGVTFVNRTFDETTMAGIVNEINNQPLNTRFIPKYNNYAYSIYSSINVKNWNFYLEYAGKSEDVIRDNQLLRDENGEIEEIKADLINPTGQILYGSVSYSTKGFGVTVSGRDIQHYMLQASPLVDFATDGLINFLPPMGRQNSLRLPARYQANALPVDETGFQMDITYSPTKTLSFNINYANVFNNQEPLFREFYIDFSYKKRKAPWKIYGGMNMVDFNQEVYQQEGKWVNTITPFAEFTYKFDRKKSLRTEFQYMLTGRSFLAPEEPTDHQDLGDWIYGLVEFNIAPKYSFSISDMYNYDNELHYYDIYAAYTVKANRFAVGYAKQVEGIVCTGGVCRFEPAFSGVKMSITSTF